jgi:tetrapyrrole methylase family protein / MazG family protein
VKLTVVGLGPGPAEWLTEAARARLTAPGARIFARTRMHPALAGVQFESFDTLYDQSDSLSEVESAIAARLLSAAGEVVLAVPGDGILGEAVLQGLRDGGAEVEVVPGVPLGIGALVAAGVPVSDGSQMVEATSLGGTGIDLLIELNPRWPAVVTGVFSRQVASDLKLALQRSYPAEHAVSVVHHAGLSTQSLNVIPLAELDRERVEFDHLTHVVMPAVPMPVATGSPHGLRAIVSRLRAPEIGCPWDLEQTHQTLVPYVIEEAYEVVDAIEQDDTTSLADELGDLLLQVVLHAEVADQNGEFEWNDVIRGLSAKLLRRHPHVFGEVAVRGADDVVRNWDLLKAAERSDQPQPASALDRIPKSLPALKHAAEQARKASQAGFDWPTRDGTLDKVREELSELLAAETVAERREELGDLLWIIAKLAMLDGIDAEEALRASNHKFASRFQILERLATERGWRSMADQPISELLAAWTEAKRRLAGRAERT